MKFMQFTPKALDPPGVTFTPLNFLFFVIGISGVWLTTHSLVAVLFAVIASIHVRVIKE
jgi:hypothetical protein